MLLNLARHRHTIEILYDRTDTLLIKVVTTFSIFRIQKPERAEIIKSFTDPNKLNSREEDFNLRDIS